MNRKLFERVLQEENKFNVQICKKASKAADIWYKERIAEVGKEQAYKEMLEIFADRQLEGAYVASGGIYVDFAAVQHSGGFMKPGKFKVAIISDHRIEVTKFFGWQMDAETVWVPV
jgi:hypothetical protein